MTFEEIIDQVIALLKRRGRVTYRTLQRQFNLDEAALADLKEALLYEHPEGFDDTGQGLMWKGEPPSASQVAGQEVPTDSPTPRPSAAS